MKTKIWKSNAINLMLFLLFVMTDQVTKHLASFYLQNKPRVPIIPSAFGLSYVENSGAAWGIFSGRIGIFAIITCIVIVGILFVYIRMPFQPKYRLLRFTIVLLLSGAVGNFIDRMKNKFVVDFFDFHLIDFPVFNVADIFVCISAFLLLYCFIFKYKEEDLKWK